jgi:high-affinity iron transporter
MLPTFVIGLREGIEAALIVGIIAAYVQQRGRRDALRWVWAGIALAAALCLGVGVALHWVERALPQREQEQLETVISVIAISFITYMILWMRKNSRGIKHALEGEASAALARNSVSALVLMAFLAVLREGFETSVFLVAVFQNATDPVAAGTGVMLGLLIAAGLGYALYRGGVRINLSRFFRVTGVVLVFVAAGLAASALHTAHEAGWFNSFQMQALDLTWLVEPGTVRAALLTGMLGLQPKPTVGELGIWLLFVIPLTLYVVWPQPRKSDNPSSGSGLRTLLRRIAAPVGLAVLTLFLLACGTSTADDKNKDSASTGAKVVEVSLTDAGCDPAKLELAAGPTTFQVTNKDAAAVTEFEVMDGDRILGEVENLTPGLKGSFSLNLTAGSYTLYCPFGKTAERGTLTVTGDGTTTSTAHPGAETAVNTYRTYVESQADILVERTGELVDAVLAGDIEQAKAKYAWAREPYERIEPVAESFGDLDPAIDAREGDVPDAEWGGFHRIEKALWADNSLDGMDTVANKLLSDVKQLQSSVKDSPLDVAQIANGAVELLNEVSASKITGEEERYSHTDLVDFQANVEGAKVAYEAVHPILQDQNAALADEITKQFDTAINALEPYRTGDSYVAYTDLTQDDTRKLSQIIDALAEPLSQVAEQVVAAES